MYFNASERIASNTAYSRSLIEKVDAFLASSDLLRFDLGQASDLVGSDRDLQAVLAEYVGARVLKSEVEYLCPIHDVRLEPRRGRVARCIDCERDYPFEDCKTRYGYVRVRTPDRPIEQPNREARGASSAAQPWWQDAKFWITTLLGVGVIFATLVGPLLGRSGGDESSDATSLPVGSPSSTEPTVSAEHTVAPHSTPDPSPEVTAEPVAAPSLLPTLTRGTPAL